MKQLTSASIKKPSPHARVPDAEGQGQIINPIEKAKTMLRRKNRHIYGPIGLSIKLKSYVTACIIAIEHGNHSISEINELFDNHMSSAGVLRSLRKMRDRGLVEVGEMVKARKGEYRVIPYRFTATGHTVLGMLKSGDKVYDMYASWLEDNGKIPK